MTPKPQPNPAADYTPPDPVPESPPLMDELTARMCWACIHIDNRLARVKRALGRLEVHGSR